MPPKKAKKPRTRRAPAKKNKGLKQKQKQRQVVNVQVSAGGSGGGGTQFIPMPQATQAPQFDYSLLASLIRPANTVDVPIRAAAPVAESVATRAAEPEAIRPSFMNVASQTEKEMKEAASQSESLMAAMERPASQTSTGGGSSKEAEAPYGYTPSGRIRKEPLKTATKKKKIFISDPAEESEAAMSMGAMSEPSFNPRSRGFIPPGGIGGGQRTEFEEDIFGRSMPKTSSIRPITGGGSSTMKKSNVVSFGDLTSGGEESGFITQDTERATAKGRMSSRGN